MRHTWPKCAAANPAGASRLQSVRPVRRVAGSLAMTMTFTVTQLDEDSIEPESPEKTGVI